MKIVLLSIGNEIVNGETINTNASFLSRLLKEEGYEIVAHFSLKDEGKVIAEELQRAIDNSDIVMTTGGLGPTIDDITKRTISNFFEIPLEFNETFFRELAARFQKSDDYLKEQAMLPRGVFLLKNRIGTAAGLVFTKGKKICCCLPGVPGELEEMAEKELLPYLKEKFPPRNKFFLEQLGFFLVTEAEIDNVLKKAVKKGIDIGIYPEPAVVQVMLSTREEKKLEDLRLLAVKLQKRFEKKVFSLEGKRMEEVLLEELILRNERLILAESCTGGALSAALTSIANASQYFLGSIVSYSNELKKKILGVKEQTLIEKGAVSAETVAEMLKGALELSPFAAWALAISGIAGPTGASAKKPVGTVVIGILKRGGEPKTFSFQFPGDRKSVIKYSVNFALAHFLQELKNESI